MEERVEHITPYGTQGDSRDKGEQVRDMFDSIAPAYDRMNRLMTMGIDLSWRRRCVRMAAALHPHRILDLATGTGDMAIALARAIPEATVTGADLSSGMVEIGRRKVAEAGLGQRVNLEVADALHLPYDDATFDVVTIAFGVRNFEHLDAGYAEMARVLRPGGTLIVLELTPPSNPLVRPFYNIYTRGIIPALGKLISHDSRAYTYLPESIAAVPARRAMAEVMERAGLTDARWKNLTLGVATIYTAKKA